MGFAYLPTGTISRSSDVVVLIPDSSAASSSTTKRCGSFPLAAEVPVAFVELTSPELPLFICMNRLCWLYIRYDTSRSDFAGATSQQQPCSIQRHLPELKTVQAQGGDCGESVVYIICFSHVISGTEWSQLCCIDYGQG